MTTIERKLPKKIVNAQNKQTIRHNHYSHVMGMDLKLEHTICSQNGVRRSSNPLCLERLFCQLRIEVYVV